jgi:hypothetical protein
MGLNVEAFTQMISMFAMLSIPSVCYCDAISDGKSSYVCVERYLCNHYYKKSQDCATAGDYSNCMMIKLGKKAYDIDTYICQIDGSVVVDHLTQMGFDESLVHVDKWRSHRRIEVMSIKPRKLSAVLS